MGGAPAHPLWTRIQNVPFVCVEDETDVQLEKMGAAGWVSVRRSEGGYDGCQNTRENAAVSGPPPGGSAFGLSGQTT